jgi:hypothetical protein
MSTVLCNQSMQDLDKYYTSHGTRMPFIRGNPEATASWIEVLGKKADTVYDLQPVTLVKDMTEIRGVDRLTASQVVTAVLNFEGEQPFHGICCSGDGDDTQSLDEEHVYDDATIFEDSLAQSEESATPEAHRHEHGDPEKVDPVDHQEPVPLPEHPREVVGDPVVETTKVIQILDSERPLHFLQPSVEDCITESAPPVPTVTISQSEKQLDTLPSTKHSILTTLNQ